MQRGIVMEMASDHMIVMTKDGQFLKIPQDQRNCHVGEEVLFTPPGFRLKKPLLTYFSAIAAAVVFCIVAFVGLSDVFEQPLPVVAYVSIDINPSLEVGIDEKETVREVRGLNVDGNNLATAVSEFKGKSLPEFTEKVLEKAEAYFSQGEGDIVISSTVIVDQAKIADEKLSDEVKNVISKHLAKANHKADEISVTALATPPDVREKALNQGLSAGKYAIYLTAKNNGADVTLEQFQSQSIHNLAKQRGGIGKLINPDQLPTKQKLKQLLQDENDKNDKGDSRAGNRNNNLDKKGSDNDKNDKKVNKNDKDINDDKKNEQKKTNGTNKVNTPIIHTPEPSGVPSGPKGKEKVRDNKDNGDDDADGKQGRNDNDDNQDKKESEKEKIKERNKEQNDDKEKKKQDEKQSIPPADEIRRPEKPHSPDKPDNSGKKEQLEREKDSKKQEKRTEHQGSNDNRKSDDNDKSDKKNRD